MEGPGTTGSRGRRGRMIAVEGPSGVGKSTTSRALARALGAPRIAEAIDRLAPPPSLVFRGAEALSDLEVTLLQEERRRFRDAETIGRTGIPVVLDTGFLGPVSYAAGLVGFDPTLRPALERTAREARRLVRSGRLGLPDVTVYLDLAAGQVARQIAGDLRRHPRALRERHARVAAWERRLWLERFRAIAPDRLLVVRGGRPLSHLLGRLGRRLAGPLPERPPSRELALRTIGAFAQGPMGRPTHPPRPPRLRSLPAPVPGGTALDGHRGSGKGRRG